MLLKLHHIYVWSEGRQSIFIYRISKSLYISTFQVFLREVDRWSGLSDDNNSIYHTHIKIRPIQIIGNWKGNK